MSVTFTINVYDQDGGRAAGWPAELADPDTPVSGAAFAVASEENRLTLDDVEPGVGSVVLVVDGEGEWPALHTTSGWINYERWIGVEYHNWFDRGDVYLILSPASAVA